MVVLGKEEQESWNKAVLVLFFYCNKHHVQSNLKGRTGLFHIALPGHNALQREVRAETQAGI